MGSPGEWRKGVRALVKKYKCECSFDTRRHFKIYTPNGYIVVTATSSGCPRALKNLESELKRYLKKEPNVRQKSD